jgi:hypothetical protein
MNVQAIILLLSLSLPGMLFMARSEKRLIQFLNPEENPPPLWLRLVNHFVIVILFIILGVSFYQRAGFTLPSFTGIHTATILISVVTALIHVGYYYLIVVKRMDERSYNRVERSRRETGIFARVLYGGIVEEIMFRFGLLSFIMWALAFVFQNELIGFWIANLAAAFLFALAHVPGMHQLNIKVTVNLYVYSISMNMLVGIVCGWLFWTNGLEAAIVCHMLFHIIWYIFESLNIGKPMNLTED